MRVERAPSPVSVRSSEVTTDSFKVSWQHAASDISLYKLSWTPANGGETREVVQPHTATYNTTKTKQLYRLVVLFLFFNQL